MDNMKNFSSDNSNNKNFSSDMKNFSSDKKIIRENFNNPYIDREMHEINFDEISPAVFNPQSSQHNNDKPCFIRDSFGILCYKRSDLNEIEFLCVKKRNTYPYLDFINGKYYDNDNYLSKIFSMMTFNEKYQLLKREKPVYNDRVLHYKKKQQQEKKTNTINYDRLKTLINSSKSSEPLWEIPKGRKDKNETKMDTAIRELEEETGITRDKYNILMDIDSIVVLYRY